MILNPTRKTASSLNEYPAMGTNFVQLTNDWNAEPNAPIPTIEVDGDFLILAFRMNAFRYSRFDEGDWGEITFRRCSRYRLGSTSDEGWSLGQCRFSKIAPLWGEFYEVSGDLCESAQILTWHAVPGKPVPSRHYLFYFRDETFECDAESWSLVIHPVNGSKQRPFSP